MKRNLDPTAKTHALLGILILFLLAACSQSPGSLATPTPTTIIGGDIPPESSNLCEGLSGTLEMQVLVGPSDAVGLEPIAIGTIPFSVTSNEKSYTVQGGGALTYEDVLEQEWGTFTVNFDQTAVVSGMCTADEQSGTLDVLVDLTGEQNVVVVSEGFQAEYPWSGTQALNFDLPIFEGASAEGEGWIFILHLNE
jgi:hypothetical protein